ncbi:hypothetical protein GCM10017673_05070 [Streptosporangium violaceochromogenes]|nr:hypothetical protein GCM10017673_05070 [Streptosporangium violaceochromogenes]
MTGATPATPVRHRPTVTRTFSPCSGAAYRMVCTCGLLGVEQAARRMAQIDLDQHVLSLPPIPAARRCRDPRGHDRHHWEPCGLCEGQTSLFDLTGGEG